MSDPMDTLLNPNFTYHLGKVSCMRGAYFAHVIFCYFVFLTGIGAFVSRLTPTFKWTHVWFGRAYIITMLWATATSLIIHNSGLPPAVLISFVWTLGGMTIAWVSIKFHELKMERLAFQRVTEDIAVNGLTNKVDLQARVGAAKGQIAESKTFKQRFFSIKALHGIIMFVSWINIAGRIFASNQSGDFTCHTYPVYKPIDTPATLESASLDPTSLTLLPTHDPKYDRLPWAKLGTAGWGAAMSVGPFFGAAAVGAVYSWWVVRKLRQRTTTSESV